MISRFIGGALALAAAAAASVAADPARYMPAQLIAETAAPKPGSTILVGFRMTPREGWHGYWSNPGDSGIAPSVEWTAPKGVTFGPLLHPAPTLLTADGISSFVHEGPHVLLSRMTLPASLPPGTAIPVEVRLSWAACNARQCVPLHATLKIELVAGKTTRSAEAGELDAAARKLPRSVPGGSFAADGSEVRLVLPASIRLDPRTARFFPDDNDAFAAASGRAAAGQGAITIAGLRRGGVPASMSGVVTDGRNAYRVALGREAAAVAQSEPVGEKSERAAAPMTGSAAREIRPGSAPGRIGEEVPGRSWNWAAIAAAAVAALAAAMLALRWRR